MGHVIIGDIHGCHAELLDLLDAVSPGLDDRIVAVGDIVDRGAESEQVLQFFRDHPRAISIMGNHEYKHLRSARGEVHPALSQEIVRRQLGDRYPEWLRFMATFPRHVELPEAIIVHGFMEPGIPLEEQKDAVVIGTMSGEQHMLRNCPVPWYEHYAGPKPLVVGHHDYLGNGEPIIREGRIYCIDTGCCHGHRLTALLLPSFRVVSVPSRGDHWRAERRRHHALAGPTGSWVDVEWMLLEALGSPRDGRSSPPAEAGDSDLGAIWADCVRLVHDVRAAATSETLRIMEALGAAADWPTCAERTRAARFAVAVGRRRSAALLFAARRGVLDENFVTRRCPTPRHLAEVASDLGVAVPWAVRPSREDG